MKRDDLAAARIPTQPSQDPDDFVDTDLAVDPGDDVEALDVEALDVEALDVEAADVAALDVAAAEEPPDLDDRSKQILDFERQWWRQAGSKEQAVRDTFNLSATRYYQLLNALLDNPLALAHDPIVVQRLRRLRASRSRRR
ncbi:DUF3263 domain-containing protein [Dactylosporangium siamense]|uniref:DUF3263 domain-containing protein n=1 Tax=Dactylosporangium siamense TaxID=685454 RepID=A0A919PRC5_9ACTN|nr:DUF3263 domain-containing protein [Dactylosporangium siamense]GIG46923.1 hypothetical protein Dsi01nite_049640 [Dactylosporangium siamense]